MNTTQKNPYVGPRTFLKEEGHLFFGRDREARDLSALVASDKLVLFYAQSGAGKSSLINTRLIPELEDKLYEVLPVARVSGSWLDSDQAGNIYVYNLLRSLIRHEVDSKFLLDLSLSGFLARLNEDEHGYFYDSSLTHSIRQAEGYVPWRRALIIDQFEELFSTHPEAWEKREDFFLQLAQAMQDDPYLWVVLVMREDYIAALDPYAHIMSNGLRTRYYMQRLSREAAINAVRKPVEDLRPYEDGVAEKLVEDLSRIKVQKPDGTQDFQPGQYVEPVQLQVVCYGLWENLPLVGKTITERDLLEVGDVDEALGKYYAGRVAGVAQAKHVKERLIREWIERKLIAPGGIRSMVLQETNKKSGGISDDVIQALQSDLVRAENRGGALWYELTHDRLVAPILNDNKKWFDENLSPLQRQASIWNDQDRNESWLLRDQALAEMEDWAKKNPDDLTDLERDFLAACREKEEQIKLNEQARSAQRLRRFVAIVGLLALAAVVAAVFAFQFGVDASNKRIIANTAQAESAQQAMVAQTARAEAEKQGQIAVNEKTKAEKAAGQALAGSLVAQADSLKNTNYRLALLIGIEAYGRAQNLLTRTTLFHLMQFTPYIRRSIFAGPISSVAVSPDGTLIAVASCSGNKCSQGGIKLLAADMSEISELSASTNKFGSLYTLAFSPDGKTLAAGGCVPEGCATDRGQITFWDVSDPKKPLQLSDTNKLPSAGHKALVKTIAFSPDGKMLASGSYDTTIILWDVSNLKKLAPMGAPLGGRDGHSSFVNSVVFSPDGSTLISAGDDTKILLWDVQHPGKVTRPARSHNAPVNSVAFSPDGKRFASAGDDNIILLWNWDPANGLTNPVTLSGHTGYVKSVAFNKDGTILATAGFDNKILLWNTEKDEQIGAPLNVHTGVINNIAFETRNAEDKNLSYLISGSNDNTVIQWDLSARQPLSYTANSDVGLLAINAQSVTDSNNQFQAQAREQQINILYLNPKDEEVFLTLDDFDSPVQYVKFDALTLRTIEQNQVLLNRMTRWNIDSDNWVELACEAIKENLTSSTWDELWNQFRARLPQDEQPKQQCIVSPN